MNYLLYAIFKIPMILCDELYDIVIQGYLRWDPISMYGNFSLHFPTMATETSLDDALGVYGAFGVHDALGVHDAKG